MAKKNIGLVLSVSEAGIENLNRFLEENISDIFVVYNLTSQYKLWITERRVG
ncbi:MAG: hypothetical protein JSV56_08130 [Methanomassiliicoccales archaeon]|nr:MAG: hypothetical protein JSV56_08130 [Methanomassiliicoccales archaeon]